jgi:hypothetical protein
MKKRYKELYLLGGGKRNKKLDNKSNFVRFAMEFFYL